MVYLRYLYVLLIVLKEIIYSFNEGGDCILETIFYEDTLEEINDVEMLEFEVVEFEHNWVYTLHN